MVKNLDVSFRSPKVSEMVLPIFRQDHTPIPDYFLDKIVKGLHVSALKLALVIFREMHKEGKEEITTYGKYLRDITQQNSIQFANALTILQEQNVFKITFLDETFHPSGHQKNLINIKYVNRINYIQRNEQG